MGERDRKTESHVEALIDISKDRSIGRERKKLAYRQTNMHTSRQRSRRTGDRLSRQPD